MHLFCSCCWPVVPFEYQMSRNAHFKHTCSNSATNPDTNSNTVSANGQVVPSKWVNLSFSISGEDLQVLVKAEMIIKYAVRSIAGNNAETVKIIMRSRSCHHFWIAQSSANPNCHIEDKRAQFIKSSTLAITILPSENSLSNKPIY